MFTETYRQPVLCVVCLLILDAFVLNQRETSIKKPFSVSPASVHVEHPPILQSSKSNTIGGEWRAASYRGLIMGQSTYADMLNILGPPTGNYSDKVDGIISYTYDKHTDLPGILTVIVDQFSGKIIGANINPRDLSRDRAITHFGNDFVITKYSFDNCTNEARPDQLYESSEGTFTYLEYRERGIALLVNSKGDIGGIRYLSKPLGNKKATCK